MQTKGMACTNVETRVYTEHIEEVEVGVKCVCIV